jgi:hypothetical protein
MKNLLKYIVIGFFVALPSLASVVSLDTLKTYFTTGSTPTQTSFTNLIDTLSATSTATTTREVSFLSYTTGVAWTNMPAAETELLGASSTRQAVDTTAAEQIRVTINQSVTGATNAVFNAFYSTDTINFFPLGATTSVLGIGIKAGSWGTLPPVARSSTTYLAIFGVNGDGTADPAFREIKMEIREVTRTTYR